MVCSSFLALFRETAENLRALADKYLPDPEDEKINRMEILRRKYDETTLMAAVDVLMQIAMVKSLASEM